MGWSWLTREICKGEDALGALLSTFGHHPKEECAQGGLCQPSPDEFSDGSRRQILSAWPCACFVSHPGNPTQRFWEIFIPHFLTLVPSVRAHTVRLLTLGSVITSQTITRPFFFFSSLKAARHGAGHGQVGPAGELGSLTVNAYVRSAWVAFAN